MLVDSKGACSGLLRSQLSDHVAVSFTATAPLAALLPRGGRSTAADGLSDQPTDEPYAAAAQPVFGLQLELS